MVSLQEQFTVTHVEVGGIDFSVWKIFLKALKVDKLNNKVKTYPDINAEFRIVTNEPLVNEVKKVGVIIDRGQEM